MDNDCVPGHVEITPRMLHCSNVTPSISLCGIDTKPNEQAVLDACVDRFLTALDVTLTLSDRWMPEIWNVSDSLELEITKLGLVAPPASCPGDGSRGGCCSLGGFPHPFAES